jgi:hypothetical protein
MDEDQRISQILSTFAPPVAIDYNLLETRILNERAESTHIEFKREFDPALTRSLVELTKDIAAISNSGGGIIAVGLSDDGDPILDSKSLSELDPAVLSDKLRKYCGDLTPEVNIASFELDSVCITVLKIHASSVPIVFLNPGTYSPDGKKQETVFSRGQIYFRHGAKSEVATPHDLSSFINKRLEEARYGWLKNVAQVITAPPNTIFVPAATSQETASRVRVTTDPSVPVAGLLNTNLSHPHRQIDLIRELNRRLRLNLNSHDVYALRVAHNLDSEPQFRHKSIHGNSQYSDLLIDWIIERYEHDNALFQKARDVLSKKVKREYIEKKTKSKQAQ